ncbi:MAG: undecaprenyldiphospho-muramoylpentapeptide beta-N-acetylglucosaminyltransferase [Porphyromonas sp.]|nr:undecaprenyldiphospho-muramoylpentapeptide beta-N-acetylglucosaminyltransferase [Porphyromonas sp.]
MERVIISGGGTGGHIFPAISIANEIRRRYPKCRILFVGAHGRLEADKVPEAGYEILLLKIEGLSRGKNPFKHIRTLSLFTRAYYSVKRELKRFRPEVVIGVGGYASAPTLMVARSLGIPTVVQEQNSYAGVTNKIVGKGASAVCVAYRGMEKFFPKAKKVVLTGNPVRADLLETPKHLPEAYEYFDLSPDNKTLLVLGGSLGARTINRSTADALAELTSREDRLQVIWQCGKGYAKEAHRQLREQGYQDRNVHIHDFISRMDYAYSVADLVISRAGAGSISEFSLLGLPVILVPSPNVAEDHQTKNAQALAKEGAALMIKDAEAEETLYDVALRVLDAPEELASLSKQIKGMALPNAAEKIVDEIELSVRTVKK